MIKKIHPALKEKIINRGIKYEVTKGKLREEIKSYLDSNSEAKTAILMYKTLYIFNADNDIVDSAVLTYDYDECLENYVTEMKDFLVYRFYKKRHSEKTLYILNNIVLPNIIDYISGLNEEKKKDIDSVYVCEKKMTIHIRLKIKIKDYAYINEIKDYIRNEYGIPTEFLDAKDKDIKNN